MTKVKNDKRIMKKQKDKKNRSKLPRLYIKNISFLNKFLDRIKWQAQI